MRSSLRAGSLVCFFTVCTFFAVFTDVLPAGESVTWNPLGKVEREADTLLLADFTSAATIEAQGGYLLGLHNDWTKKAPVGENYEFGPGRSGPAIRGTELKPDTGAYSFVQYALDGIIPADEFTVELSFKADRPWEEMFTGRGFFSMLGGNSLSVMNEKTSLVILVGNGKGPDRRTVIETGKFALDDQKWHSLAFTWKRPVLTVWLDGKPAAEMADVAWNDIWSDSTHADGILIGGTPGIKSPYFWVSDLRVSRTARIPGVSVPLRSLVGSLTVDAAKSEGLIAPYPLGSLHPGATPSLVQSALQVVRTDKLLTATPIKRGAPDEAHPVAGASGKFSYDWQVCDRTFAWFKANKVRPYISIDSTPQLLGGGVPPYTGKQLATELSNSSGFSIETPNDWDDWAVIVGDLIDHVVRKLKVEVPWWGVWNEPGGPDFGFVDREQYLTLYARTVAAVRAVDPKARVGGPELAAFEPAWIEALFARCAKDKLPLDFIAYHDYSGSLRTQSMARETIDELAARHGFKTPFPVVVTEFNWAAENMARTGKPMFNIETWHLKSFSASYLTAWLSRFLRQPENELVIFSGVRGDVSPRQGSWDSMQLFGPDGMRWGPTNAMSGWKRILGDRRLASTSDLPPGVFAFACRSGAEGRVGLALANYGLVQHEHRRLAVSVRGLKPGSWKLTRWQVDEKHSSRWDIAEDRPEGAAQNDLQVLDARTIRVDNSGAANMELDLPRWSSLFIALDPAP